MRTSWLGAALALLAVELAASALAGPIATHTGAYKTRHFTIRYRPDSRAAASVERTGAMAERDLLRICEQLKIEPKPGLELHLYDNEQELRSVTGTWGNAGFSAGNASHVPYDNDQTRYHEMVHIVAVRIPASGMEQRNFFHIEGLANGLLEHVHGIPVHAVAAYYRRDGALPALAVLAGSNFYQWIAEHPGFNAYDVAGSYYRFLMDTFGAFKVRQYYTGTSAQKAFGKSEPQLERLWHKVLLAFEIRPEVSKLLQQRHGEEVLFEPYAHALRRALEGDEKQWTSLAEANLASDGTGTWTRKDSGAIEAVNKKGAWAVCELGKKPYRSCAVRATIRTPRSTALQVRLGRENQAMLVNGTFLYRDDKPAISNTTVQMTPTRKETDFMLVRYGQLVTVWIDGKLLLRYQAAGGPALPGIAIHQGAATFESVRVRSLD